MDKPHCCNSFVRLQFVANVFKSAACVFLQSVDICTCVLCQFDDIKVYGFAVCLSEAENCKKC
jgi:hypothetical protein